MAISVNWSGGGGIGDRDSDDDTSRTRIASGQQPNRLID